VEGDAGQTFDLKTPDAKFLQETAWNTVQRVKGEQKATPEFLKRLSHPKQSTQ
jgi:hypothetical protein